MLQPVSPQNDLPLESQRAEPEQSKRDEGALAPLRVPAYRAIWIAYLFANLGVWAQSVAAAWVVTSAQASPLMVAMIQVAASLPLVILSIVSGVVADNYDRRRIMLVGLGFEISGGVFVTACAFLGYLDPILLIMSILWISLGAAITIPAWQAAVNEQVPKRMVGSAVLLNSVNYNVARALGPALGGLLLSLVGPAWVFLFNCFCYVTLIWAIWRWRRALPERRLPPERLYEGVVAALHFTQYSSVTRLVMARSFAFGLSASSVWALLPLVAHQNPRGSASLYGLMLGALGLGAIFGSTQVGRVRQLLGSSRLISAAAATLALMLVLIGVSSTLWLLFPALIMIGSCWIAALATYNTSVQLLVPDWVKARALALYQTALYSGLALGSFLWGHLAETMGVHGALLAAGILLLLSAAVFLPSRLPELDPQGTVQVPLPRMAGPSFNFDPQRGSVQVSIEYRIPTERTRDFVRAARALRKLRMRNGAERWSLYRDIEEHELWQEVFLVRNWLQHLRMLDRMTISDKVIIDAVMTLHAGEAPPRVRHGVSYRSAPRSKAAEAPVAQAEERPPMEGKRA
ncbi:MFS transporter [Halotalea alkalilenta]|uniref:MFS transporter n=1 Tax=Halotalea alkalilenta TaxID=376489 RepID=UPI00048010D7|nr:MFS transporter [Halotalea alkalilenta]